MVQDAVDPALQVGFTITATRLRASAFGEILLKKSEGR
jgi:hypothetical protein